MTGHTTERGLRSYDREDEGEYRRMSNIVQGGVSSKAVDFQISSPRPVIVNQPPTQRHLSTHSASRAQFNPFPSFASIFEEREDVENSHSLLRPFSFQNCNVTINLNNSSSSSTTTAVSMKRKRLAIYSSSEDELSQS